MTFYIDTSVLVAAIVDESASTNIRAWLQAATGRIIVSDLARLEFAAVVSRAVRTNRFNTDQAALALGNFDRLCGEYESLTHGSADFARAERLVRDFATKLAGPDALHLASAMNNQAALVTIDRRLVDAARLRGAAVVTPG